MNFTINFYLNAKKYKLKIRKRITVQQIISILYGKTQGVVLEYNKDIVNINVWNKIYLKSNDNLEILTIVGGG
jgi:thiamine biosynthesis protein ThiS